MTIRKVYRVYLVAGIMFVAMSIFSLVDTLDSIEVDGTVIGYNANSVRIPIIGFRAIDGNNYKFFGDWSPGKPYRLGDAVRVVYKAKDPQNTVSIITNTGGHLATFSGLFLGCICIYAYIQRSKKDKS